MGCSSCGAERAKVIYFGLPGVLCLNNGCNLLTGLAAYVPEPVAQFAASEDGFSFMVYKGSYWRALREWLHGQ